MNFRIYNSFRDGKYYSFSPFVIYKGPGIFGFGLFTVCFEWTTDKFWRN